MENSTDIQVPQTLAVNEVVVFATPEVADLGAVSEVTLGSGGFNKADSTMYWQG
ncbi:hypothetical protein [Streptomyces sp. 8L]|uniref:hypothetical protein n=1 Tax=Streptomyces sp. 8L TaxID=2877242 RepID=UPI001CD536AF|nr:hypothetical protein [Streptomyces sp. 8L]MCA1221396.1 hypothetical protein [Streptomyces sp. 8L]